MLSSGEGFGKLARGETGDPESLSEVLSEIRYSTDLVVPLSFRYSSSSSGGVEGDVLCPPLGLYLVSSLHHHESVEPDAVGQGKLTHS